MAHSTLRGANPLKKRLGSIVTEKKLHDALLTGCQSRADSKELKMAFVYADAYYPGDGSVEIFGRERPGASAELVASGKSILFMEYGSGIKGHVFGRHAAQFGFTPGSWSHEHANAIRTKGSRAGMWVYKGERGGDAEPVKKNGSNAIREGFWWTTGSDGADVMADEAERPDRLRKTVLAAVRRKLEQ